MSFVSTVSQAGAVAVVLLTGLGCRADVERAAGDATPATRVEVDTPITTYTTRATLILLGVAPRGRALRTRLRLQNLSDGLISYEGCAVGKPAWHWQYFDGGAWNDGGALNCDGKPDLYELAPEEVLKFDVEFDAKRPSSRIGVRVAARARNESTLIWSETIYYEAAPSP